MKATQSQQKIFERTPTYGHSGTPMYPIFGSGEHRSARSMENKGIVSIVSCSPHAHWFVKFNSDYWYNWKTHEIESTIPNRCGEK